MKAIQNWLMGTRLVQRLQLLDCLREEAIEAKTEYLFFRYSAGGARDGVLRRRYNRRAQEFNEHRMWFMSSMPLIRPDD